MDSDTEESAQDYNQTPVAPVDATQGDPSLAPQDTHDIGANTPQPKTAAITATSTQTKAQTTTATTYATVTAGGGGGGGGGGGSGGGGGGGAAPAGHPANGKLIGNPPHDFTGDRTRSKKFLLEFELY